MNFLLNKVGSNLIRCVNASRGVNKLGMLTITSRNYENCVISAARNFSSKTQENVNNNESMEKLEKFIEKLQTDLSLYKKISVNQLKESLKLIPESNITSRHFQVLLESLSYVPSVSKTERIKLLEEIWSQRNANVKLNDNHYLKLLQIFKENKFAIDDYEKFLNELEFQPGINIYLGLLDLCCEMGDLDNAKLVIGKMKEKQFPIEESLMSNLIRCHSRMKNLLKVHEILDTMSAGNIEMTSKTHTELIRAYIENDKIDWARKVLQEKGLLLNEMKLHSILHSLIYYNSDRSLIIDILKYFPKDCINNAQIDSIFRNFMVELVYNNRSDDVVALLRNLPVPDFKVNENFDGYAAFLINEFISSNQTLETVVSFCNFLIESKRNLRALHVATESALHKDSPLILDLYRELSKSEPLRTHYFWPIFQSYSKHTGEAGILSVIKLMQEFKVEPDFETCNQFVLPKLSITLKDPKQSMKIFEDHGLSPSLILSPLVSHLLYQHRINEIGDVLRLYNSSRLDTEMFIWPLALLVSNNKSDKSLMNITKLIKVVNERALNTSYDLAGHLLLEVLANNKIKNSNEIVLKLLGEYALMNVNISRTTSDMLKQQFTDQETFDNCIRKVVDQKLHIPSIELFDAPQNIPHPRDMTLEELECHLVELQTKNLNTRGVLRRLLQLSVRENKLDRALEIKKMCEEQKVEVSPGMLASIFDLHIKTNNAREAEEVYKQIKKSYPGFLLDEHKILDFAAVLVENDQISKAKQILKERNAAGKIKGGLNVQKNIWNLLTAVANHAKAKGLQKNQSKMFYQYLKDFNYATNPTNTTFGPMIREHLIKDQVKEAVQEYLDICKKTRKTPLQMELVKLMIEYSNKNKDESTHLEPQEAQEYLQEILQLSASIYGTTNTNSMMVIATAEAGTENQLRRLLMDQNIKIVPEYLLKQCEFLGDNGKIDVLLKLGRSMRGLEHHLKVNEMELYNLILKVLSRKNDFASAITLFDRIINESDFRVTAEFTKNLISLLERNKLEIPTNIAIHAK